MLRAESCNAMPALERCKCCQGQTHGTSCVRASCRSLHEGLQSHIISYDHSIQAGSELLISGMFSHGFPLIKKGDVPALNPYNLMISPNWDLQTRDWVKAATWPGQTNGGKTWQDWQDKKWIGSIMDHGSKMVWYDLYMISSRYTKIYHIYPYICNIYIYDISHSIGPGRGLSAESRERFLRWADEGLHHGLEQTYCDGGRETWLWRGRADLPGMWAEKTLEQSQFDVL